MLTVSLWIGGWALCAVVMYGVMRWAIETPCDDPDVRWHDYQVCVRVALLGPIGLLFVAAFTVIWAGAILWEVTRESVL